ncbi:MAG: hypothetical protein A2937_02155 [Candidatus Yonathbacteria bacterium RIFCSPLOWO2_01_FULL_47_33b]|uniref:Uncharacterized protein n=1 Tax=Candidatus Yonathbacteria bacterium RIFCSPLOWO2_01_FULL_47_33b TaxID=1802727 RepID=A0A1G2SGV5_9BACT|nr:MAG: hypothetical protein A2937_02155 [Candidatus Yonathbacteria bacterium RIFCSPLOWO2_01_FULL_47_33b]
MKKYSFIILAVLTLIIIGTAPIFNEVLRTKARSTLKAPSGHTWTEYKNKKLGFVIAYPSDISHPYEARHPAAPNGFTGADTLQFLDDALEPNSLVFLWIAKTKANDAESWFYGSGLAGGKYIATTTTIGGALAVGTREIIPSIAYNQYNLNFVHGGELWSLYIQDWRFLPQEIEYIGQSFRFLHWWERI